MRVNCLTHFFFFLNENIKFYFVGAATTVDKVISEEGSVYSTITPINAPFGFENLAVYVKIMVLEEGRTIKNFIHEYEVIRYHDPLRVMYFCPQTIFKNKPIAILMHSATGSEMKQWLKVIPENVSVPPEFKFSHLVEQ